MYISVHTTAALFFKNFLNFIRILPSASQFNNIIISAELMIGFEKTNPITIKQNPAI
jgi:hypothetical protein